MSNIVQSYDASNNVVYPVTHLRAVRDSSGTTLESMMQDVREITVGYYECSTPGSTAAKAITIDSSVSLSTKILCKVKFVEKNIVNNATMNINGTGAKALYYNGVRVAANNSWYPNEVVDLYYDGTNYHAKSCAITWEGEDNKLVKFNKILDVSDIESNGDDDTIYIPRDKDALYLGKRKIAEIKESEDYPPKWSASEYITSQESIENDYPTIIQGENISYSSSDTEVATINQNGEITLLNFGETSIKAENAYGSDSYILKVYPMELDIPGREFSLPYSKAIEDNLVKEYKYTAAFTAASERGLLLKSSGEVQALSADYRTSEYIPCEGAYIIKFNGLFPSENNNWTGICLYDSNKNFLWAQTLDNLPTVNNGIKSDWEKYVKSVYVINRQNSSLGSAAYFRFSLFDPVTSDKFISAKDQISIQVFYTPVESTLVLGNSITLHDITSYWWGEWGMAASSRSKDFVHELFKGEYGIWSSNPGKNIYAANLAENFERSTSTTAKLKEVLLNTNLKNFDIDASSFYSGIWDFVVIRLGENVTNDNSFESRLVDLLLNITDLMPQIKIIVTGMFWTNGSREDIIQRAVNTAKQGNGSIATQLRKIKYISINEYDNSTYKEVVGHSVLGDDLKMHTIENSGVANHPNDMGMTAIANKIIDNINF